MTTVTTNPLTENVGSGKGLEGSLGNWYQVKYITGGIFRPIMRWLREEFVFIPTGQSLAKEVRKHVRKHSIEGFPFSRDRSGFGLEAIDDEFVRKGIHGAVVCLVVDITLLTSDGQKISGIRPRSIVKLFEDYVHPAKE